MCKEDIIETYKKFITYVEDGGDFNESQEHQPRKFILSDTYLEKLS